MGAATERTVVSVARVRGALVEGASFGCAFGRALTVHALSPLFAISIGGCAIDAIGWRSLFVAQAAVAAIAVLVAVPVLPETATRRDVRFDVPGAALLCIGMVGLLLGINRAPEWGLDHVAVRACGVARRISDAMARIAPAPAHTPSTAAIMGCGQARMALTRSPVMRVNASRSGTVMRVRGSIISNTSPPEQKLCSAPVSTITRMSDA
jgi:hypothetical protein